MVIFRKHQLVNVWSLETAGVPLGFICASPTRMLAYSVFRNECVSFPFQGKGNPYVLPRGTLILL